MCSLKMIDCGSGRSIACACLLGLALVALSPIARAGADTGTQVYKPSPITVCGMRLNSENWNQGPWFKKYVESGGNVAAVKAVILGKTKMLETLIKQNPELVNNSTLLMFAADNPHPEPLAIMLAHGANPNTRWDSAPLLFYSVACPSSPNTAFLLQAGANVYETNAHSDNAMYTAIITLMGQPLEKSASYIHGIELLLAAGYDPRCPVNDKFAPIQIAQRLGKYGSPAFKQVVKLLKHAVMIAAAKHPGPPECGNHAYGEQPGKSTRSD